MPCESEAFESLLKKQEKLKEKISNDTSLMNSVFNDAITYRNNLMILNKDYKDCERHPEDAAELRKKIEYKINNYHSKLYNALRYYEQIKSQVVEESKHLELLTKRINNLG